MSSKIPTKPQQHLFVVKDGQSKPDLQTRMYSTDQLDAEQRRLVDELIRRLQPQGVLIGALVNNLKWDVRPLLLQDGVVSILRFTDPQLGLSPERLTALQEVHKKLAELPLGNCLFSYGISEGQLWVRRRYFQHTLHDGGLDWLPFHPLQFAQRLIRSLQAVHQAGVIHGHLGPSNVSFDERGPVLFDHGFFSIAGSRPLEPHSLAPELLQGRSASAAADVYGLGVVLRILLGNECGGRERNMIDRMGAADPGARPSLQEVASVFIPTQHAPSTSGSSGSVTSSTGTVGAGKMLGPSGRPGTVQNSTTKALNSTTHIPAAEVQRPKIINTSTTAVATPPRLTQDEEKSAYTSDAGISVDPKSQSPESHRVAQSSILLPALALTLLAAGLVLHRFGAFSSSPEATQSQVTQIPYANYWTSNQPSKMALVADAALQGDSEAQLVIIADAMRGASRPLVRGSLIRTAFNPAWERALGPSDRDLALRLSLARVLTESPKQFPSLADAHPAIALALAGDLPDLTVEAGAKELSLVSLERMSTLPQPYGRMFGQLGELGVQSLDNIQARALSHILVGDATELSVQSFFQTTDTKVLGLAKIAILLPLMERAPALSELVYVALLSRTHALSDMLQWFSSEEMAEWSTYSKENWFSILVGGEPKSPLSFAQLVDLLQFPDRKVRERAKQRLLKGSFSIQFAPLLDFLSSEENRLSRWQTISILSAFKSEGEVGYSLLANVLDTQPDARSILKILLARSGLGKSDPFSLDLSRYLSRTRWQASLQELKLLVGHPERHTRVLAYSRLDPTNAEQLQVLQNAVVVEPHEATRRQLEVKIASIEAAEKDPE